MLGGIHPTFVIGGITDLKVRVGNIVNRAITVLKLNDIDQVKDHQPHQ